MTRRRLRRLSRQELGAIVGLGKSTTMIYLLETGQRQPSADLLARLARALKCDPIDLIEPEEGVA